MTSSQTSETASNDATSPAFPRTPADVSPQHTYGEVRFQVARMDVETFNRIKQWQRSLTASTGQKLSNSQVLRMLILSVPAPTDADGQKAT